MQALQVFVTNDAANPVPVMQQGTANVNVLGSVVTRPNIPATQFSRLAIPPNTLISGPDPAGTSYAITSISIANPESAAAEVHVLAFNGPTSDCLSFSGQFTFAVGPSAIVPAGDTVSMVFPQPFVLTGPTAGPGSQSCLKTTGASFVTTTIVGYRL
jgi:hypothetical protein